jgi:hypothetical protein
MEAHKLAVSNEGQSYHAILPDAKYRCTANASRITIKVMIMTSITPQAVARTLFFVITDGLVNVHDPLAV